MQQTITLIGHLTNDPDLKTFPSGSRLTRFRLAASRKVRRSGELGDHPRDDGSHYLDRDQLYIDVECWGNLAENTYASLLKGKPVICVGYLTTQQWESKDDGQRHSKVVLRAMFIGFEMRNHVVQFQRNPLPQQAGSQGANLNHYGLTRPEMPHQSFSTHQIPGPPRDLGVDRPEVRELPPRSVPSESENQTASDVVDNRVVVSA